MSVEPRVPELIATDWRAFRILIENIAQSYNDLVNLCLNSENNLWGHTPAFPRLGIRTWNFEDCLRCSTTDFSSLRKSGLELLCSTLQVHEHDAEGKAWCALWNCSLIQCLGCVANTYSNFLLITNTTYDPRHFACSLREAVFKYIGLNSISCPAWEDVALEPDLDQLRRYDVNKVYDSPAFLHFLICKNFAVKPFTFIKQIDEQKHNLVVLASKEQFREMQLALAMATHPRLGKDSHAKHIEADHLQLFFQLMLQHETIS